MGIQFSRAVLVDDDPISNFVTSQVIKKMEVAKDIIVLKNGQEAFEFFKEQVPGSDNSSQETDLVLLDINMAVMNGFELLEALYYTDYLENRKIVLLSSSQNPRDVKEAAKYRIHGYLNKPLTAEKLYTLFS